MWCGVCVGSWVGVPWNCFSFALPVFGFPALGTVRVAGLSAWSLVSVWVRCPWGVLGGAGLVPGLFAWGLVSVLVRGPWGVLGGPWGTQFWRVNL